MDSCIILVVKVLARSVKVLARLVKLLSRKNNYVSSCATVSTLVFVRDAANR